MKKFVFILFFGLFSSLYALDATSGMPSDQKKIVNRVVEVLQLPDNAKSTEMIYKKLGTFFEKDWSAHWTTNETGSDSKIKTADAQICDVTIYNNNRVVNCTFVHFKKQKQLFVTLKQYIEAESSDVLDLYNETKADSNYVLEHETDNYAYFQEKGFMSYNTYHIKSPVGMVVYESSYFLDVE